MELEKKKEYVFRYWAGEKAIDLGREMIKNKEVTCLLTIASKNVFRWQKGVSRSDYKKSSFYQLYIQILFDIHLFISCYQIHMHSTNKPKPLRLP